MDIRHHIPVPAADRVVDAAGRFHAHATHPAPPRRLQVGAVLSGPVLAGPQDPAGAWARFREACGRGGAEAFAFARVADLIGVGPQAGFGLLVVDISGGDGADGIAALKAAGCTTPVLALTTPARAEANARALAAGVELFLSRPVRERDLVQALGFCAARKRVDLGAG